MLERFKEFWAGTVLHPFVRLFIRMGISPDAVTLVGTLGVSAGALIFFPQGELLIGVLFITAFVFSDLIDGRMAREMGRVSKFGAFWTRPSTGSATARSSVVSRSTSPARARTRATATSTSA